MATVSTNWIRSDRKALGWTAKELSRRSGIAGPAISRIETGKSRPSIITLWMLAAALGRTELTEQLAPFVNLASPATESPVQDETLF